MSETDTVRHVLSKWCVGKGVDIGFGGSAPIVPGAICIDRDINVPGRAACNDITAAYVLDAFKPLPFADDSLDYVYSSHCLEDAIDTEAVLIEWCRIIKPGGYLVLFLPDQQIYIADCEEHKVLPNEAHKHAYFSLYYVLNLMPPNMEVVYKADAPRPYNRYSFELVAVKEIL